MNWMHRILLVACCWGLLGNSQAQSSAGQAEQVLAQARAAFEAWEYAEALKLYRSVLKDFRETTGSDGEAAVRVGDCLFQLGRYAEAAEAYSDAIQAHPTSSARFFPRLKVADCLVKMGRIEDARRLYQTARELYGPALGSFSAVDRIEWLQRR